MYSKVRRFLRSSLCLNIVIGTVLTALLLGGLYTIGNIYVYQRAAYRVKAAQLTAREKEIALDKAELAILEKKQQRLMESEGVEDAAREKLGMVRRGEIAYVVDGGEKTQEVAAIQVSSLNNEKGRRPTGFLFSLFGPFIF